MTSYTADGKAIVLGERLGRGGEGDVHALSGDFTRVVKLYTLADLGERDRKIAAMVRRQIGKTHSHVAFPGAVVSDEQGRFRGFTMPRAAAGRAVHDLYSPASRKQHFRDADLRFLVHVAINVTRAVGAVHAAGCVIGDINHSGFLVGANGMVTVIDADSFQFQDGADRYLCRVGVPEFTAPELQGRSLDGIMRSVEHDAFGLAVLLFQLLYLGRHPFAGVPKGGDLPLPEAIQGHHFAYSRARQTRLAPPPNMLELDAHGTGLAGLFEAAFAPLSSVGRPKVDLWLRGLMSLRDSLKCCATIPEHYHTKETPNCPWCRIEKSAGVVLFLTPFQPNRSGQSGTMPTFDLAAMRARLAAFGLPQRFVYAGIPHVTSGSSTHPSSGGLMGWIKSVLNPMTKELAELTALDKALQNAFAKINDTVSLDRLWKAAVELAELAQERNRLDMTYAHSEENARQVFRKAALIAFLDSRLIRQAKISGISFNLQTMLAAFGYETAADVKQAGSVRLQQVQGIGPVKAQALIDWTKKIEQMFQMPHALDAAARSDLRKTQNLLIEQAQQSDRDITRRLEQMEIAQRRISALRLAPNADIMKLVSKRTQLATMIAAKQRSVPNIPQPLEVRVSTRLQQGFNEALRAPVPTFSKPPPATPISKMQGTSKRPPSCPKCGKSMVQKVAYKGSRRGQKFYGCSQFPRCNGLRNIP